MAQSDPFRRFEGASLTRLLLSPDDEPRPPASDPHNLGGPQASRNYAWRDYVKVDPSPSRE